MMYDISQTVPTAICSFLDGLSSGARLFKDLDMTTANVPSSTADDRFSEVLALIHSARHKALQAVNTQLIELYWQVGAHISRKLEQAEWGDSVVSQLAGHLAQTQPGLRGFTRRNLFRMRQFYEAYRSDEKMSALLTQLPWTHNLLILTQSKLPQSASFICAWRCRRDGRRVSWNANSKLRCSNAA